MTLFSNKMDWSTTKGKILIMLLSLGVILPITGKLIRKYEYPSLEKAEEACIAWQQTGQVHQSLAEDEAISSWGRQLQTVDPVIPLAGRRFSNQLNGKSLVLSRICTNDRSKNEIIGTINTSMEDGTWSKENTGTYQASQSFHY
jgi:hypothetical protein